MPGSRMGTCGMPQGVARLGILPGPSPALNTMDRITTPTYCLRACAALNCKAHVRTPQAPPSPGSSTAAHVTCDMQPALHARATCNRPRLRVRPWCTAWAAGQGHAAAAGSGCAEPPRGRRVRARTQRWPRPCSPATNACMPAGGKAAPSVKSWSARMYWLSLTNVPSGMPADRYPSTMVPYSATLA
jgi:hypothetical protein